MREPRIVTPQEAQRWETDPEHVPFDSIDPYSAARTIATEDARWSERIAAAERAAVVKAYRYSAGYASHADDRDLFNGWADAIENGADLYNGHRTIPVETTYLRDCLDCEVTYNAQPAESNR